MGGRGGGRVEARAILDRLGGMTDGNTAPQRYLRMYCTSLPQKPFSRPCTVLVTVAKVKPGAR